MVTAIKVNGEVLREQGDTVFIPFGSEYSLYLKNINNVRARVDITIDDQDVLNGSSLVIDTNESFNLEGFLRGNDVSHKFKFIEKTQEISNFRGDRISDGLIQVKFRFELPNIWPSCGDIFNITNGSMYPIVYRSKTTDNTYTSALLASYCVNDSGITVKGSDSDQHFSSTTLKSMEIQEHVIVLQLKGVTSQNQPVITPLTVKTKIQCESCGKRWLLSQKFCGNCGTSLVI